MAVADSAVRDGLFLEYRVEGSTGPDTTRVSIQRFTFHHQPDGRFEVRLEGEDVLVGLYTAAYGAPLVVDAALLATNGVVLQFGGHCPLLLTSARAPDAEVAWTWDGAGVEELSSDPQDQITVKAKLAGPIRWRKWNAWILRRTDLPPGVPAPVAYYHEATGVLVGVEYGADLDQTRFIYCDAELQASSDADLVAARADDTRR